MALYLRVAWHHALKDEPVWLISEIIDDAEVRKVEIYADGRHDYADVYQSTGTTSLSVTPMPSITEIAEQEEFTPEEIDENAFEVAWRNAIAWHRAEG